MPKIDKSKVNWIIDDVKNKNARQWNHRVILHLVYISCVYLMSRSCPPVPSSLTWRRWRWAIPPVSTGVIIQPRLKSKGLHHTTHHYFISNNHKRVVKLGVQTQTIRWFHHILTSHSGIPQSQWHWLEFSCSDEPIRWIVHRGQQILAIPFSLEYLYLDLYRVGLYSWVIL